MRPVLQIKPLRPHDPRLLGDYQLLGLLGEGGMGVVYLAQTRDGRRVAIKIIKPEYAAQSEFRGRFRSEVSRARQVPSFCTAAVLDADPDHETPYLVVEYVDGPNLSEVITEHGPLSGGSLHSVAVGVATALVAIHGAGVVHRDLKPPNVLFALSSPKVIDFGIARALESTAEHTRTGQMVGTLSYMAPERLDGSTATPAVDIFAWGVLVAYAATGRTPFAANSPTATAVRIMTAEPNLDGLTGTLRHLVDHALAKQPEARPTAQDLLGALLAADGPATAATGPARAATGSSPAAAGPAPSATPAGPATLAARPVAWYRRFGRARWAWVAATTAVVAIGLNLGARSDSRDGPPIALPSASPGGASVTDPLTRPGKWQEKHAEKYKCEFDQDALAVTSETSDNVICPGPATTLTGDQSVKVNFQDLTPDACALIRFRFHARAGYDLTVCVETVSFSLNPLTGSARTLSYADVALNLASRHQIKIDITDNIATCHLDGKAILTAVVDDPGLDQGALGLGVIQSEDGTEGSVRFTNVEAHTN